MAVTAVITATVTTLTFINISDPNGDSNYTEPKILPPSVKLAGASLTTWTTDAQRENALYCTAENQTPIPNF